MPSAHCPHCLLAIADDAGPGFPSVLMRCPHCRLTVAPGRARLDVDQTPGSSGSAAGLLANAARREEGAVVSGQAVDEALRTAAAAIGTPVRRLRMIDYQRVAASRPDLPALASILDARGSWKDARRAVAGGGGGGDAGAQSAGAGGGGSADEGARPDPVRTAS
jgi:hypothetical protein